MDQWQIAREYPRIASKYLRLKDKESVIIAICAAPDVRWIRWVDGEAQELTPEEARTTKDARQRFLFDVWNLSENLDQKFEASRQCYLAMDAEIIHHPPTQWAYRLTRLGEGMQTKYICVKERLLNNPEREKLCVRDDVPF